MSLYYNNRESPSIHFSSEFNISNNAYLQSVTDAVVGDIGGVIGMQSYRYTHTHRDNLKTKELVIRPAWDT